MMRTHLSQVLFGYHERIRPALVDWLTQFFPIVMMIPINNVQAWHQPMTSWWHNVDSQLIIQHFIDDLVTFAKHEQYRFVHRRRHRHYQEEEEEEEEEQQQQQQYDSVLVECHEDTKIKNNTAMCIQQQQRRRRRRRRQQHRRRQRLFFGTISMNCRWTMPSKLCVGVSEISSLATTPVRKMQRIDEE
jgi:hypothetical protein